MITIKDMEMTECVRCRFSIDRIGHAWCAALSENGMHYFDDLDGSWPPGWRDPECPLVDVDPDEEMIKKYKEDIQWAARGGFDEMADKLFDELLDRIASGEIRLKNKVGGAT